MFKVPPSGPIPARIMIVGEAPGATEEKLLQPFTGQSGEELTRMLHEVGILRNECFITNVCKYRPPGNDIEAFIYTKKKDIPTDFVQCSGKWVHPFIQEGIEDLHKEIVLVNPQIIIALGGTALWALTGNEGIMKWRGSILRQNLVVGFPVKVIPTIHPAMILRQWDWRAIAVRDLKRTKDESEFPEIRVPKYSFTLRPSYQAAQTRLNQLLVAASRGLLHLSVDIETRAGFIACIGIAWNKLEAICIPLMCLERLEGYWSEVEEEHITKTIQMLLTHPNVRVIGQNFSYDSQYFAHHWGYLPNLSDDTMIMQHCAFPGTRKGLDFISSMYCKYYVYWKDEGKNWDPKLIPEDRLWNYNCLDAVNTFECFEVLTGVLRHLNRQEVYNFQMKELHPQVLLMTLRGCRINTKARGELSMALFEAMAKYEQLFIDVLGQPLNPRSNKQMKDLFYGDFKQKEILNYKTGNATLNDEALHKIAQREPLLRPLVEAISDYRTLGVYQSTFVEMPLDLDGRVRTSFGIAGTETFRFSSGENAFGKGGNLQNIPGADKTGGFLPNIRILFIPDIGYVIIDADLEKADAQVVAWEADDKILMQMFREGVDIHLENAKVIYQRDSIKKDSHERQMAKMFVHGTNYGGAAKTMAAHCGITVHEAERAQRNWFSAHPNIRQWHTDIATQLQTTRTVSNKFGYKRFYFERLDDKLVKHALAWIPQSTVACVINRGLVNISRNLPAVQLLLQVHDSLVMQAPEAQLQSLLPQIHKNMLIPIPYPEPLIIQVGLKIGKNNWGELESVKL
ncbi:MAG: DNA polymerase [Minisyncoccota bacterium]